MRSHPPLEGRKEVWQRVFVGFVLSLREITSTFSQWATGGEAGGWRARAEEEKQRHTAGTATRGVSGPPLRQPTPSASPAAHPGRGRGWAPWGPAHEAPCGQAPWAAPPSRFRMLRVVPAQAFSPRFPSCWKEGLTDVSLKTSEDLNQNLTH